MKRRRPSRTQKQYARMAGEAMAKRAEEILKARCKLLREPKPPKTSNPGP